MTTCQIDARYLLAFLQQSQPAMEFMLAELATLESPSDDAPAVGRVLNRLQSELEDVGFVVRRRSGHRYGGLLYARPRMRLKGRPAQLLVGHCDTVWPIGSLPNMPVGRAEERLRGPGVFDMKGGLVQMIYALRALRAVTGDLPATPVVVVNSDEEAGSVESKPFLSRLARRAVRAFVLEPAFGQTGKLKTSRKAVGSFEIVIRGRAAHAGIAPEQGVSAVLELSHQIQRLFALNEPSRGISVNVGTIDGGIRSNVVAPEVRASVDVRVRTREDAAAVETAIRGLQPVNSETCITVTGGFEHPPLEPSPRNRALWFLARQLSQQLGFEVEDAAVGGASDGNTISQFTATLDGLGAVGDGAHASHEYVDMRYMAGRAALLALLLAAPLTFDQNLEPRPSSATLESRS